MVFMKKIYFARLKAIKALNFALFLSCFFNSTFAQSVLPAYLTHSSGTLPNGWSIFSAGSNSDGLDCGGTSFQLNSASSGGDYVMVNYNATATGVQFYLNINGTSSSNNKTLTLEESSNGTTWTTVQTYTRNSGNGLKSETILSSSRYVRWRMTQRSGGSFDIDGMQVYNTTPYGCYCASASTHTPASNAEYISNVSSGSFANPTSGSNYANYISNDVINSVAPGTTFTVNVSVGNRSGSDDIIYVYADWNNDGDFIDAGELAGQSNATAITTVITVTVPAGAALGSTTLRVRMGDKNNGTKITNSPCQTFTYGEVEDYLINVFNPATITIGAITGSPFCITPSAGASVTVPYTSTGTFSGNTYTAQLSDASGSFAAPVNIGSLASNANSGNIAATIPANTATGTGYKIRVVSSNPAVNGSSSSAITINLAANNVTPAATQNIVTTTNGTTLTVAEQSTPSSRTWFYGTTSGGPYTTNTGISALTYMPNFATPGTYYIVCVSTFACGTVTSNQVQVNVSPSYKSQFISANTGSATWCAGETRTVSVTVKNVGTATWTDASPDINIGVKWNADPDYLVRVNAGGLAPGATQTYNLTVTAPATTGTNNLTFDAVEEGISWFGDNNGNVGPGNVKFTSPAQTITTSTNSIAPSGIQNINAGANGATLTVTSPLRLVQGRDHAAGAWPARRVSSRLAQAVRRVPRRRGAVHYQRDPECRRRSPCRRDRGARLGAGGSRVRLPAR